MRSVVVTGASSGIGRAIALDLAGHGYHVIATARTPEKAEKLAAEAAAEGNDLSTVLLDVTDPRSCQDAADHIARLTDGGPWALVNNAGIATPGAFEDVPEDVARAVLETNLLGAARMTRLVLPAMRRRGDGRVVMMSSIFGLVSAPFNGWYSASKFALEALSDALRVELTGTGVRVSLIEPGFIDTPMISGVLESFPDDSRYTDGYIAARRLVASAPSPGPDAVARVVRRALNADTPRRRYLVGPTATMTRLIRLLPAAVLDRASAAAARLGKD
jgi:NAD(P)-dependent dehydrogenase (short-subunit alcohol dehydrogenase family)